MLGTAAPVRCADGGEMKREAGEMCRAGGYCSSVIASERERASEISKRGGVAESPPVYFHHQLLHKSTPVYVRRKSNYCARKPPTHAAVIKEWQRDPQALLNTSLYKLFWYTYIWWCVPGADAHRTPRINMTPGASPHQKATTHAAVRWKSLVCVRWLNKCLSRGLTWLKGISPFGLKSLS